MKALVVLLSLIVGCTPPSPHIYTRHDPIATLDLAADTEFTPTEREYIDTAIYNLEVETSGFMQVTVHYDLNFSASPQEVSDKALGHPVLVRMSEGADVMQAVDIITGERVLAWTDIERHATFLVAQRLYGHGHLGVPTDGWDVQAIWVRVTMHEMLHSVGLEHVKDDRAVMYVFSNAQHQSTCFTQADKVELCRVLKCDPKDVRGCQ